MKYSSLIFLLIFPLFSFINPIKENNEKGEGAYKEKKYLLATDFFKKALSEDKQNSKLLYNIGTSFYFLNDYEKAKGYYEDALSNLEINDNETAFNLYFAQGNNYFKLSDYEKAIDYYKKALDLENSNQDLKKNLEIALKKLKEKNESSKEKKSKTNNSRNDSSKTDKSEKNKTGKKSNPSSDLAKSDNKKNNKKPSNQLANQQKIDRKIAEAILKAFENRGQDSLIKKRYQEEISPNKIDKNW